MKVAIMQPYAFPYLGYFQLIHAVDKFILLDDVSFIKQGWINRNVIAGPQGLQRFVFPVKSPKSHLLIYQVELYEMEFYRSKFLKTIEQLYSKAPFYMPIKSRLEEALSIRNANLVENLSHMLKTVCEYLGIDTKIITSSKSYAKGQSKGQERVISICQKERASTYINLSGGTNLYDRERFKQAGIRLFFLQHIPIRYDHFLDPCPERLSIIDLMMFNDKRTLAGMLDSYRLF